jgi:hypothetical protein
MLTAALRIIYVPSAYYVGRGRKGDDSRDYHVLSGTQQFSPESSAYILLVSIGPHGTPRGNGVCKAFLIEDIVFLNKLEFAVNQEKG